MDLAPIRVNAINPGAVETPVWGEDGPVKDGMLAHFSKILLTEKVGNVEDVAEAYLFVIKDRNCEYWRLPGAGWVVGFRWLGRKQRFGGLDHG